MAELWNIRTQTGDEMMNFSPFTGHIPAAMPTIHQFAAKFGYEGGAPAQEGRGYGQYAQHEPEPPAKFRQENAVVSLQSAPGGLNAVNSGVKYQTIASSAGALSMQQYSGHVYAQAGGGAGGGGGGAGAGDAHAQLLKADAKREYREEMAQELMGGMMQQAPQQGVQHPQQLVVLLHDPKEASKPIKQELRADARLAAQPAEFISAVPAAAWQSLAGAGGAVADYLSSLPLGLHHLLKYSADGAKREDGDLLAGGLGANMSSNVSGVVVQASSLASQPNGGCNPAGAKRKKKKKPAKERKPRPRPGEIRLTTALDGSTLYCCPECHMAYPERGLLEQHLVGHTMERRFICDICNAALKRKDHLTRHKQSHNPERPYVCSVCLKAFKRKEQLTLHFVIHSGEKRHVCQECGKGFYRKDHLRKHTRSHIARRVKAELTQQSAAASAALARAVPAPPLAAPPHPAPPP